MIKQEFTLDDKWLVRVLYSRQHDDSMEAMEALEELNCPRKEALKAYSIISSGMDKGFTYTNHLLQTTLMYIGVSSDRGELSNICAHFGIREDGEAAAELIAYIVQKMWEDFEILLKVNYDE